MREDDRQNMPPPSPDWEENPSPADNDDPGSRSADAEGPETEPLEYRDLEPEPGERWAPMAADLVFVIRILGRLMALAALYLLWGRSTRLLWWTILILLVLEWLSGRIVIRAINYNYTPPEINLRRWIAVSLTLLAFVVSGSGLYIALNPTLQQSGLPERYLSDRDHFVRSISNLEEARQLYLKAVVARKHDLAAEAPVRQLEARAAAAGNTGLAAARDVRDEFLEYLDPDLKRRYRNHLVAGFENWRQGIDSCDLKKTFDGNRLLGQWDDWWAPRKLKWVRTLEAYQLLAPSDERE